MGEVIQFPRRFQGVKTKKEIARYLRRSTRFVEIAMRDQELPFSRNSHGHACFDVDEVERWRQEREEAAS